MGWLTVVATVGKAGYDYIMQKQDESRASHADQYAAWAEEEEAKWTAEAEALGLDPDTVAAAGGTDTEEGSQPFKPTMAFVLEGAIKPESKLPTTGTAAGDVAVVGGLAGLAAWWMGAL